MNNLTNKYIFQAIDAYPYNLEECIEALHYALSYNDKNVKALCLMGRMCAEQLKDYETAKAYFQEALVENIHAIEIYPYYINTLLWNEDFTEAERLINFAFTIKGIDRGVLYAKKASLFEHRKAYKTALKHIKQAKNLPIIAIFYYS